MEAGTSENCLTTVYFSQGSFTTYYRRRILQSDSQIRRKENKATGTYVSAFLVKFDLT